VPSPRTNGEVTTVLAHMESDLESLKRLVAAAASGTG
jgi:immune inhibitor A